MTIVELFLLSIEIAGRNFVTLVDMECLVGWFLVVISGYFAYIFGIFIFGKCLFRAPTGRFFGHK